MRKTRYRSIEKANWKMAVYENKKYWTAMFKSLGF